MSPMKKTLLLAAMAGLSLSMMLSVIPITIAHADPANNDTVTITVGNVVTNFTFADDSNGPGVDETRANFPAGFTVPVGSRGRVDLKEADGSISDTIWTHITATNPHFHYISDPILLAAFIADNGHEGDSATDLGSVTEVAGPIDVSAKFGNAVGSVIVTSDVSDGKPDVPEPATLSLLVVGLAGLGYRLRQRKR